MSHRRGNAYVAWIRRTSSERPVAIQHAYVMPKVHELVARLDAELSATGLGAPLRIMQSNGGLMSSAQARVEPVRTLLSGPAGGGVGAVAVAGAAGLRDGITMDMGGTSLDITLARDGRVALSAEGRLGGFPVKIPQVDTHTIGAGGGSIARFFRGTWPGRRKPSGSPPRLRAGSERPWGRTIPGQGTSASSSSACPGWQCQECPFRGAPRGTTGEPPRGSGNGPLPFRFGRTEMLPDRRTLELYTMCGHGMVSANMARKMRDWVREGRRTPQEGARYLAKFCTCGIYNVARAARLLEEGRGTH